MCVTIGRGTRPAWAWASAMVHRLFAGVGLRPDVIQHPSGVGMRRLAMAGVIVNIGIIVSGGLVRVTDSGLGCPTWPRCTGESLLPAASDDRPAYHTAIEFGNRLLTYVVLIVAVAVFVGALHWRRRLPGAARLAVVQPVGVVAQAVLGGVTVLTGLHPVVVGSHYLLSIVVLTACVVLWHRTHLAVATDPTATISSSDVGRLLRRLTGAAVVCAALVLVAGTVVTGAGPHAGDERARRYGFLGDRTVEWTTRTHAALAWVTVAVVVVLGVVAARAGVTRIRQAVEWVVIAVVGQGMVGYVQYAAGVPASLVVLHMLGSALVWVAVVRLAATVHETEPCPRRDR